jgi:hypothetical protein
MSNVLQHRDHLVGINRCDDRSPDLRLGAVTGDGRPITPSGQTSALNHFNISITNQPGAFLDISQMPNLIPPTYASATTLPTSRATSTARLGNNDLRRTLTNTRARTSFSVGQPALNPRTPATIPSAIPPVLTTPGESTSARRRHRYKRTMYQKVTQALLPLIQAPAPDARISELVAAVASMREELKAARKRSTSPADSCRRAPLSPPGPPPETTNSDAQLQLAIQYRYAPQGSSSRREQPAWTPDAQPLVGGRPFRALRDSDPLLRRRLPRSRSPIHPQDSSSRCCRLDLDTPTSSDVWQFLSPLRLASSGWTRSRSPSRGSRSSSSAWSRLDSRVSKRLRSDSPPRPASTRPRVWRPATTRHPPGGGTLPAGDTPLDTGAPHPRPRLDPSRTLTPPVPRSGPRSLRSSKTKNPNGQPCTPTSPGNSCSCMAQHLELTPLRLRASQDRRAACGGR